MSTEHAGYLPQADASTLVDRCELELQVQAMYRELAHDPHAPRHFATGGEVALRIGYPQSLLDEVPADALARFAGVGYHFDLAGLEPGDSVLDLGSGSGTDVFCAAALVGARGLVVGVDFTDAQLAAAGFAITARRRNDYTFMSERALDACTTYGVESVSIAAVRSR